MSASPSRIASFRIRGRDMNVADQLAARLRAALPALFVVAASYACSGESPAARTHGSAGLRLKAVTALPAGSLSRTVYVPVYSSIYLGKDINQSVVELGVTVSVRNVSRRHPVVLSFVQYYDSAGTKIRDYITGRSELAPLATVEFVVAHSDTAGGPGANFLIQWAGGPDIDEPLIEAIMVGQSGNAGISFSSPGRTLRDDSSK